MKETLRERRLKAVRECRLLPITVEECEEAERGIRKRQAPEPEHFPPPYRPRISDPVFPPRHAGDVKKFVEECSQIRLQRPDHGIGLSDYEPSLCPRPRPTHTEERPDDGTYGRNRSTYK